LDAILLISLCCRRVPALSNTLYSIVSKTETTNALRGAKVKPALIIIDMQKDFQVPGGLCYDKDSQIRWEPVTRNIKKLLEVFRSKKLPVIHVVTIHRQDYSDVEIGELSGAQTMPGMTFNHPYLHPCGFIGTTGAEVIDELKPKENETIVVKKRYSGFFNTDLDMVLRRKSIDTLFITGGDADCCVRFTSADAYFRDYNVIVVTDCVQSDTKAEYDAAIHNIRKLLGTTRTLVESTEWLDQVLP
jgi:nicotinamidase-related amidase